MLSGRVRCIETNDPDIIGCIQRLTQVVVVVMLVAAPLSTKRGLVLSADSTPPLRARRLLPLSRW